MTSALSRWPDYLDLFKPGEKLLDLTWAPEDDRMRAELYRQFLMDMSLGYFIYFQSSTDYPDFLPILNSVYQLQPNPDDVYLYAPIDGALSYRISGDRGSVHILNFSIGRTFPGVADSPSGVLSDHDADDLEIDPSGRFEILLSAEKPAGHTGNWWQLDPKAEHILVRCRSYDWLNERSPRLAIETVEERPLKPRITPEEIDRLIRKMAEFPERLCKIFLDWQNDVRDRGYINKFNTTGFSDMPGVPNQVYWHCVFELEPDEALVLETELPARVRYWNVQLNDPLFNSMEFIHRQSSLNGHTATLDADGRFRAVISQRDPGIANWLDPCGYENGTIIGRWNAADSCPMPTITRVKMDELTPHLRQSPPISPDERRAALRARRLGAQLRRRW